MDIVRLRLFPFSLLKKAKMWFYSNKEAFTTWEAYSNAFLAKYYDTLGVCIVELYLFSASCA